jgi:16S rRNA processing protein RimM
LISPDTAWAALAHLLRPQGRRGELLADLLTDLDPEMQFGPGRPVFLGPASAVSPAPGAEPTLIESFFLPTGKNAGRLVLKLTAANSISEAELLAGQKLMVPASEMPALDEDTFYVSDLVCCTLIDGDIPVGRVVDVEFAMSPDGKTRLPEAAPLLAIQPEHDPGSAGPRLIPFVRAWLQSVDLPGKRITMALPPGLLETVDSDD